MLRINLLPGYVAQRRLTNKLILYFAVGFGVIVAALLVFQYLVLTPELSKETADAAGAVAAKTAIDALNTQATTIASGVAPIAAKLKFVNDVAAYNQNYIKLYTTVAQYTSPKILYTGMAVTGSTLTINAYTPSIADLGRYLQIMYTEPDFKGISISTIPGGQAAAQKLYYYKGVLIGVDGGTTASAVSPFPGVPPGVPFTPPAGAQIPIQKGTATSQVPPAPIGARGFGGQPGFPAAANTSATQTPWARIQAEPDFNPKFFKVVVRRTDGFIFTATATLNQSFTPPAPPGNAGSAPTGPGQYGGPGQGGG